MKMERNLKCGLKKKWVWFEVKNNFLDSKDIFKRISENETKYKKTIVS